MCGIAGIVAEDAVAFVDAARNMVAALAHRGPDSHGVEYLGPCVLGNTRLAIIDLSPRGRQPMSNEERSVWITYNGETYNAGQLRELLVGRGHRFRSTTDTEVVLHLYEEYGERCVEQLRGMFAFAIWDARKHKLVLARDRLGIKPLYYAQSGKVLFFASEMKALLASGSLRRKLDPAGLRVFLQLGHIPPPWTAIQDARPLQPGHVAIWQDGELSSSSYWRPAGDARAPLGFDQQRLGKELSHLLVDAARHHLISDVPIALFMSGGVDSACLAAAAQRAGAKNLTALTIGFPEPEFDESELSARTAHSLDLPHRIITLSPHQVREDLDRPLWAMDQPTVDGLNSYWISQVAAEAGFKVAISGQGGDELFGGYESLPWFERFNRLALLAGPLPNKPARRLLDRGGLPFRWRKLSYLVGAKDRFVAAQLAVKVLFLEHDVQALLGSALAGRNHGSEAEKHLAYWAKQAPDGDLRERLAFMDLHTHLEPRLLRDMDAMSMAHSLEVRPVFLDHCLVEFVLAVPSSIRMRQKRLLLEASRHFLPGGLFRDLLRRKKRTFTFPFTRWLMSGLRPALEETFAPARLQTLGVLDAAAVRELLARYWRVPASVGWSRIWSLFVLQRWCETMKVSP